MEFVEPSPDVDQQAQMDLDENHDQSEPQVGAAATTVLQTPNGGVAPEPNPKKLTVAERLDRISEYRIRWKALRNVKEPSGRGGKAEVVRATFKRNTWIRSKRVAVKKILRSETTDEEKFSKEFVHEVELLAKLSHENIVELIGFVEDFKDRKTWIVLSWEPNGNVREFLGSGKWEIPERISLIKDMFTGLEYLHTREPPICHGDLKSLNILVSSSYRAIITDFGSARLMINGAKSKKAQNTFQEVSPVPATNAGTDEWSSRPESEVTVIASTNQLTLTGPVWSLRWAAPEVVGEDKSPGLASDIWSAGWVCWEIMTDRIPFEELKHENPIMLRVVQGTVPLIHENAQVAQVVALCSLMRDCWKLKPENRPCVAQCCREVKWMPSIPPSGCASSGNEDTSPKLLLEMAHLYYLHDKHDNAATLLKSLVANGKSGGEQGVAKALDLLGEVYRAQCRYTEAEESYMRAQEIYARIGNDRGRANTILGLGDIYYPQRRYAEAEESYTRAQEIYARIGDHQGRAHTLDGFGHIYFTQRRYAEAEESYTRAQEIYARIGNDQGRANIIRGLGDMYRAQCRYAEAGESYRRAQEIYARIGDDQGQARTLQELGQVYSAECRYNEVEESYTRAQEIYARIGDDRGRANAILGLGQGYRAQCRYTEAEESYTRAQEIYTRISDILGRANTLFSLGHLKRKQTRTVEAARHYAEARGLYSQIGDSEREDCASYWLANTSLDQDPSTSSPSSP